MCDDPSNDTNPPDQFISVELDIKPVYTQVSSGKFPPSDQNIRFPAWPTTTMAIAAKRDSRHFARLPFR